MNLSKVGLELLKEFEGFRSEPYLDSAGIPTIGYGATHYLDKSKVTMDDSPITEKEGERLLASLLPMYENVINTKVTVPLNQNQFDALVCFVYNIGGSAFAKSSMLKLLNASKYNEAADQFNLWRSAGGKVLAGLVKRREREKKLFLTEVKQEKVNMLDGYKTYIGIGISIVSGLLAALGKDWGVDWTGLEAAIVSVVGGLISVYGYIKKKSAEPKV